MGRLRGLSGSGGLAHGGSLVQLAVSPLQRSVVESAPGLFQSRVQDDGGHGSGAVQEGRLAAHRRHRSYDDSSPLSRRH
jgi:hypothetical protein